MLLRRIARPLLATTFIVDGVNTFLHPEPRAKKLIQLEPRTKNTAAAKLTEDPARVVRFAAASQAGAGILLALGRAPRLGAIVLTANVLPVLVAEQDFWAEDDPDRRSAKLTAFLKDAGLLGGLLLAAADTEGKPSLGWRGRRAARDAAQAISSALPIGALAADDSATRDAVARRAHEAAQTGRALADRAGAQAAGLTEVVREHGPQWADTAKERAAELADTVREHGPRWADTAKERAAELAEAAREHGPQWADTAKERAAELAEAVRERGPQWADAAKERAADAGTRLAEFTGDNAPVVAATVRERGTELAGTARRRGSRLLETAVDRGSELADDARYRGTELAENVRRGRR